MVPMTARRVVCGSLFAFLCVGCSNQNKDVSRQPSAEAQSAQETQREYQQDSGQSSVDALARKTNDYAQSLDNAIDRHPRRLIPQTPTATPAIVTVPAHSSTASEVHWSNPFDLSHTYDPQSSALAPQLALSVPKANSDPPSSPAIQQPAADQSKP